MADQLPPDYFVTAYQFTKTVYRDLYSSVDPKNPKLSQAGKVAIITGATQGIGQAIALAFAQAGAAGLVLVSRSAAKLEETKEQVAKINKHTKAICIPTDVTSESDVENVKAATKEAFGHAPTVLINSAGLWDGTGHIGDVSTAAWWKDFEVNVKGTYLMTAAFLSMLGNEIPGTIINVSSFGAFLVHPGGSSYSLSKSTMNRFTEYVSAEHSNITCISYNPGSVATAILESRPDFLYFAHDSIELSAGTCVYLCTPSAAFLNGRYMSVNWSVDELEDQKDEIISQDLLKFQLKGEFGPQKFK